MVTTLGAAALVPVWGPRQTGLSRAQAGRVMESRVDDRLRVQLASCNDERKPAPRRSSQRAALYPEPGTSGQGGCQGQRRRAREGGDAASRAGRALPLPGGPGRPGWPGDPLGPPTQPAKREEGRFNHCPHPASRRQMLLRSRASAVKTCFHLTISVI